MNYKIKSFKSLLQFINEGGNASVVDPKTGEVTALAQKLQLDVFNRDTVVSEFISMFSVLNDLFEKKFKVPLWKNFEIVKNGYAFNGSTDAFFNKVISTADFFKYKKSIGDMDIMVPDFLLNQLFDLLRELEGKQ